MESETAVDVAVAASELAAEFDWAMDETEPPIKNSAILCTIIGFKLSYTSIWQASPSIEPLIAATLACNLF